MGGGTRWLEKWNVGLLITHRHPTHHPNHHPHHPHHYYDYTKRWDQKNTCCRRLSSTNTREELTTTTKHKSDSGRLTKAFLSMTATVVGVSIYIRQWRSRRLEELDFNTFRIQTRKPEELIRITERTGLMGITGAKSVKEELGSIRKWHHDHGFKGGLVVRELTQPLFANEGSMQDLEDFMLDPMRLARRECYYLYYEITGNGEIRNQIFCRGTTLGVDVLSCFLFWMVFDDELGCRVHLGFRNQADRILQDVMPLLTLSTDKRTTIEVAGHSLGGAVAYIVAAKLRKRGYNVVRVTSVGAPRFCASASSAAVLLSMLPNDTLRIENDTDVVPLLPPFGHHVGNKLWLLDSLDKYAFIPANEPVPWVDSVVVNFRIPEILYSKGRPHRIPHYAACLKRVLDVQ